jgi:cell division septal protein FtsQ
MSPADSGGRSRSRGNSREEGVSRVKIAAGAAAAAVVLIAGMYAFHRFEQFLIRDPRFALEAPESDPDAPVLQIQGAAHASRRAIESVFADDLGKSVYLLPLAERRASLRTVDWVKDASVARVWPNRVFVRVAERKPVAFVTIGPSRFGLIDEDGVILPPAPDRFHLPVLRGVQPADPLPERRARVQRMLHVLRDLGSNADKIAEIDVADRDDVKVTQPYQGRMVTLLLGDQNFAARYQNFVNHYSEIREKLPGATTLDLRLEDRITVVDDKGAQ